MLAQTIELVAHNTHNHPPPYTQILAPDQEWVEECVDHLLAEQLHTKRSSADRGKEGLEATTKP